VLFSGLGDTAEQIAFDVLFVFAVFGCVALHEFGHALAAAAYGIGTRDITLYPVGGVASLERMPRAPRPRDRGGAGRPGGERGHRAGAVLRARGDRHRAGAPRAADHGRRRGVRHQLLLANVGLVLFNLIPAFPMDGGRVLRALLATQMPRVRATEAAVSVSTVIAALFLVAGSCRCSSG
jgi:Zn-dependent protease